MIRRFLQPAVASLADALGEDRVLVADEAGWITDGDTASKDGALLDDLSAIARRVRVYAGRLKASTAALAVEDGLHLLAMGPPVRPVQTLVLYYGASAHPAVAPPQVYLPRVAPPTLPLGPNPGHVEVVIGGPHRYRRLPLDLHPPASDLADVLEYTAAVATATYLVHPTATLPWKVLACHQRAKVLSRAVSPHHALLAHGTDGLDPAFLLEALDFPAKNPC